jgi:hypothetical protein
MPFMIDSSTQGAALLLSVVIPSGKADAIKPPFPFQTVRLIVDARCPI